MPELPEVESAARILRDVALGRRIVAFRCLHPATCRTLTPSDRARVVGRQIVDVGRRGKHQLLALDDGTTLHVHFRMAGDWHVARDDDPARVSDVLRHARAEFVFDDGARVSLVDPRALSTIMLHAPGASPLPPLGPEPTDPGFSAASFADALRRRRGPIKPVLLDQRVVAGVGNIYAAEALWEARISPRASANRLSSARLTRLADAMRVTLEDAIAAPGRYSTGETRDAMHVYGREGEPCTRCGAAIRRIVQAGRSTYYCPRCQAR
jgi:formamidopyrimidine-DNA glycosylase